MWPSDVVAERTDMAANLAATGAFPVAIVCYALGWYSNESEPGSGNGFIGIAVCAMQRLI